MKSCFLYLGLFLGVPAVKIKKERGGRKKKKPWKARAQKTTTTTRNSTTFFLFSLHPSLSTPHNLYSISYSLLLFG